MSEPHRPVVEALSDEWLRVRVNGREYVVAATCPHRKGRLVHGRVNARTARISCPLHHSTFDLTTGCPVAGPSTDPLPVRHAGTAARHANHRQDGRSES